MADAHATHDSLQHCTTVKASTDKTVGMACPYTGKGEELSSTNLVEGALGGSMLLAMGAFAMRYDIELTGARVDVSIAAEGCPIEHSFGSDTPVKVDYLSDRRSSSGELEPELALDR